MLELNDVVNPMGLINIYRNSIQEVKTKLESFGNFSAINPEIWEKMK